MAATTSPAGGSARCARRRRAPCSARSVVTSRPPDPVHRASPRPPGGSGRRRAVASGPWSSLGPDDVAAAAARIAGSRPSHAAARARGRCARCPGADRAEARPAPADGVVQGPWGDQPPRRQRRCRPPGVVAASGGNFGLAVAWAARLLGHRATIVVPDSSPASKRAPLAELGADLEVVPGVYADALAARRRARARRRCAARPRLRRPAGRRRAGDRRRRGARRPHDVDTVVVAVGGGGLLAGPVRRARGATGPSGSSRSRPTGARRSGRALDAGGPVDTEVGGHRGLGPRCPAARRARLGGTPPDSPWP